MFGGCDIELDDEAPEFVLLYTLKLKMSCYIEGTDDASRNFGDLHPSWRTQPQMAIHSATNIPAIPLILPRLYLR